MPEPLKPAATTRLPVASPQLGRKTALGGILLVATRFISRLFDLTTMLVLARLLEPSDFGLVAIAGSVVAIADATLDLPINQALIRLTEITDAQYDTAFTLSLLRGLLLTALLVAIALPLSRVYHDPRLVLLIGVLSLAPALRSLVSPRLAEYQKQMTFWRDGAIEFSGKLLGFATAVGLGVTTHSYWSLAAGTVVFPATMAVASYIFAPHRPRFALSEARLFAGFLGWISASQVINALNWQCERLLLGTLKSATQLGLFSTASDLTSIPFLMMFGPTSRPLLAAFTHLRDDPARLARSYQSAANAVVAVGLPIMVGISLLADPIVRFILGKKWLGGVVLVHWLSISLIPAVFAVPAYSLIMAFGETSVFLRQGLLGFGIKFPIAAIGVWKFGFAGLIVARLVSELSVDIFSILTVKRLIGISVFRQTMGAWRSIVGTIVMVPLVLWCDRQFGAPGNVTHSFLRLMADGFAGAAIYISTHFALWSLSGFPPGIETLAITGWRRISPAILRRSR
jgi:PST family polysaccharide transporter